MDVALVTFKANGDRCDIAVSAPVTTFGRHPDCNVQVPKSGVSRRHFQVILQDQTVKIKDLGSTNGTFLNEQRITEAVAAAGDKIRIGEVYFTIIVDGQPHEIARQSSPVENQDGSRHDRTMALKDPAEAPVSPEGGQLEEPPDEAPATDPLGALAAMGKPPKP